ncbi:MAG: TonB-dependent receptor family protein [Saprospiraceae bacterium]
MLRFFLSLFLTSYVLSTTGQTDTLLFQSIDSINITATRLPATLQKQAYAIGQYQATALQQTRQQISLQEYINHIPGLFALNAQNYAQDLRISLRGFGARSAFGIRGIKIIVDGIPETTPDGQGQIDNLNLGIVKNIEVLKGSSSTLYGNAAGGVISINTIDNFNKNYLQAGVTFGSFNLQNYQLQGGWKSERTRIIGQISHLRTDGYREQSGTENTNVNLRILHDFNKKSRLQFQVNYANSPVADDPGSLNFVDALAEPRAARDRNLLFQTGEAIEQMKLGSTYDYDFSKIANLHVYGFYSNRGFYGKLPFEFGGIVDLGRNYWGQGAHFNIKTAKSNFINTVQIGYEYADQRDQRQRFQNLEGTQGDATLNQLEIFQNTGIFVLDKIDWERFSLQLGGRFDNNRLEVEDNFLDNGDASGRIDLNAFSYSLGLNYTLNPQLNLYSSYRYSFETPALSELSANPSNDGGFNENLQPQEANTAEIGLRGNWQQQFNFDATLFYITTQNDLVPFELADFPDRTFFQNAGSTDRFGIELTSTYFLTKNWQISSSYAFSDFKYDSFITPNGDFSGNELPAIPRHTFSLLTTYQQPQGIQARLQGRYIGELFTNDANSESVADYFLVDLNLGYELQLKKIQLFPFFGAHNLLNINYFDNIRINAFGGRFYETGAGINVYGGVRFKL